LIEPVLGRETSKSKLVWTSIRHAELDLSADVWKQSHPEAVRTYRSDERRDTADRNRLTRAQRRLASAKKLAAAKLAAEKDEAKQQKPKPNKARP